MTTFSKADIIYCVVVGSLCFFFFDDRHTVTDWLWSILYIVMGVHLSKIIERKLKRQKK